MSLPRRVGVALLCLSSACAVQDGGRAVAATEAEREAPGAVHVLLTLELEGAVLRIKDARRVPGPLPVFRGERVGEWQVEARSADGALLHAVRLPAADELRAERPDGHWGMEGARLRHERAVFAVRFPLLPGASELQLVSVDAAGRSQRVLGRAVYPEAGR